MPSPPRKLDRNDEHRALKGEPYLALDEMMRGYGLPTWGSAMASLATVTIKTSKAGYVRESGWGLLEGVLPEIPWEEFVEASERAAADAEPAEG